MTGQVKSRSIDPGEMPAYTVPKAVHYLGLPVSTVRYWSAGRDSYKALMTAAEKTPAVIVVPDPGGSAPAGGDSSRA
jgi:hypothetical protein